MKSQGFYYPSASKGKLMLESVIITPPGTHTASVIWLHGLGADGHDFESIIPELKLPDDHGIKFIFPHAPKRTITVNQGAYMRAWYDIASLDKRGLDGDKTGVQDSIAQVNALIRQEIQNGISRQRILLVGFSQGGAIALQIALQSPKSYGGVIALSTYLMFMDELKPATQTTPIFMAHGTQDTIVPFALAELSHTLLKQKGYDITWHTYPIEHSICQEEVVAISAFIKKILMG